MRRIVIVTFAALALSFEPAPFPKPNRGDALNKSDHKRLQGVWDMVRLDSDGEVGNHQGFHLAVTDSDAVLWDETGAYRAWYRFSLDALHKPKEMTLKYKVDPADGHTASYALDGDVLTICWHCKQKRQERPADFRSGHDRQLMVFRRARR